MTSVTFSLLSSVKLVILRRTLDLLMAVLSINVHLALKRAKSIIKIGSHGVVNVMPALQIIGTPQPAQNVSSPT